MAETVQELIIIGAGPSGYTAATYAARARLAPTLFSGLEIGGQLMYTTEVENYPGFVDGVPGPQLMMTMRQQAQRFGTTIMDSVVDKVERRPDGKFVVHQGDKQYVARAVLIATGASARRLGLPEEDRFMGRGLSVCAVCDAAFFRDRSVVVIGGGDSAMEDALALTKFAKDITLLHRRDSFRASKIMQDRVLHHPKIKVVWNTTITAIKGTEKVEGVTTKNLVTNDSSDLAAEGLFYAIGHVPATGFLKGTVDLNSEGYITTRLGLDAASVALAQSHLNPEGRVAFPTMTSVEGIFAAGDCVDFRYRQAITAAGMGAMAALDAERWLEQ
jgi:thioredoxin reductase (NADPH)